MQQGDAIELLDVLKGLQHLVHVVPIDGPEVTEAQLFEQVAGDDHVLEHVDGITKARIERLADDRDRLDQVMDRILGAVVEVPAAQLVEVARERADRLGDRPPVIIQDHQQLVVFKRTSVVERLERDPTTHRGVADHGDGVTLLALHAVAHRDAEGSRRRGPGVAHQVDVVFALPLVGEAA